MYCIRFKDANCFDNIENFLGAFETDRPLEIIDIINGVDLINIDGVGYHLAFIEFSPAISKEDVCSIDVYVEE